MCINKVKGGPETKPTLKYNEVPIQSPRTSADLLPPFRFGNLKLCQTEMEFGALYFLLLYFLLR